MKETREGRKERRMDGLGKERRELTNERKWGGEDLTIKHTAVTQSLAHTLWHVSKLRLPKHTWACSPGYL